MKTLLRTLAVALALVALAPSADAQSASPKNPARYFVVHYPFSTTADSTNNRVAVLPPGVVLRDVVVYQDAAGTGGTNWVATPKRAATAMCATDGGFTLAAGASKATNAARSPLGQLSLPSGGTRPVVKGNVAASGTVTVLAALANDETVTVCGQTYTAKTSGATGLLQFNIGADESADCTSLRTLVNANPASPCTMTCASAVGTVKAKNVGAGGNSLTLAEVGSGFTVSGANLTGGYTEKASGGELLTMDIDVTGTYSVAVTGVVSMYFEYP